MKQKAPACRGFLFAGSRCFARHSRESGNPAVALMGATMEASQLPSVGASGVPVHQIGPKEWQARIGKIPVVA
ncbi:hypothetical protein FNZ56_03605 [Pseudoluteimonas lycopersici]|uniref:Uncharacterized protein n=1 Tax=Pseudoluteimonas lycopersici TaxID=1324796 RepID=A0A516V3B3_9GAMM|nr:hypothetical protein FNZ56_03605 [Lysobacter lycopersici]